MCLQVDVFSFAIIMYEMLVGELLSIKVAWEENNAAQQGGLKPGAKYVAR